MKPKDEPPGQTPRFSLNNIQLVNAKIVFDDQPEGQAAYHQRHQPDAALRFQPA